MRPSLVQFVYVLHDVRSVAKFAELFAALLWRFRVASDDRTFQIVQLVDADRLVVRKHVQANDEDYRFVAVLVQRETKATDDLHDQRLVAMFREIVAIV